MLRVLTDARMIPALRNGESIPVFYYGTVTFRVVENKPRLRIFANQETKELKAENDFIGPQPCLAGESKFTGVHYPAEAMAVPVSGEVDLAMKIDASGNLLEEKVVKEWPSVRPRCGNVSRSRPRREESRPRRKSYRLILVRCAARYQRSGGTSPVPAAAARNTKTAAAGRRRRRTNS
jgi:hypothetical protein